MAKQEITLKGLDGHEDHLVYDAVNGQVSDSLEECARSLFPQEGETTPRLRFKGFEGEWENAKASDLFVTFNERNRPDLPVLSACQDIRGMAIRSESGYDISHDRSNEITYKVVRPGQFVIHLRSFQGGFAHSSVEGITSPAYTVFGFKNPECHDDYFWKIIFMSKAFINRLETITYGIRDGRSISFEEFSNMDFLFPSYEEQKTIATFFRRLDTQIAIRKNQFERLQQVKSACLESMFPRGTEIAPPPIRFSGFKGNWVEKQLCDCLEISNEKNTTLLYDINDVLSVSDDFGVMNQIELLGRSYAGKSVNNYGVLHTGDIVYTKSPLRSKPFGIIKQNNGPTGIVSVLYAIYKAKDGISPEYIHYYFDPAWRLNEYMRPLVNKGAKNTMNISDETALTGSIKIPENILEQKAIANFFQEIDSEINTERQCLDKLKQMKSACLRSMFPQNGGGYFSSIRFKGFKDEWILMNFSDMVQRVSTYDISNILPCVEFEDIVAGEGVLNKDVFRKNVCKHGIRFAKKDVLFGKLRPYLKNILFSDFNGIAVGDFWVLRATDKVDPYFLFILVSSESFMNIANISSGSKMPRADWNLVSNSKFAIPPSIEEQRQIGAFFRNMDKQIALQTKKVEILKQARKACLNEMIA